jgi:Protein of unknown function (DUF1036)
MGLYFKNKTDEVLWVAYARYSPGCEGGVDWAKKGWFKIPTSSTVKVQTGWVGGSKFFYFAETDDLKPAWSGSFFTFLPWDAFDWCWNTASTNGRTLGLRKVVIPSKYMDYTIGLTK